MWRCVEISGDKIKLWVLKCVLSVEQVGGSIRYPLTSPHYTLLARDCFLTVSSVSS